MDFHLKILISRTELFIEKGTFRRNYFRKASQCQKEISGFITIREKV